MLSAEAPEFVPQFHKPPVIANEMAGNIGPPLINHQGIPLHQQQLQHSQMPHPSTSGKSPILIIDKTNWTIDLICFIESTGYYISRVKLMMPHQQQLHHHNHHQSHYQQNHHHGHQNQNKNNGHFSVNNRLHQFNGVGGNNHRYIRDHNALHSNCGKIK